MILFDSLDKDVINIELVSLFILLNTDNIDLCLIFYSHHLIRMLGFFLWDLIIGSFLEIFVWIAFALYLFFFLNIQYFP